MDLNDLTRPRDVAKQLLAGLYTATVGDPNTRATSVYPIVMSCLWELPSRNSITLLALKTKGDP